MESVGEKIRKEYELFFLDMTRTSRANIFASSREIELKKTIFSYVEKLELDERRERILSACDNLLEELYRYVSDYAAEEADVKGLIKNWITQRTGV